MGYHPRQADSNLSGPPITVPRKKNAFISDSLRGSSVKVGMTQGRIARPLREDDTHKSRSVNIIFAIQFLARHSVFEPNKSE